MRIGSALMKSMLEGSFDATYEADLYYGDNRTYKNLPIDVPSLQWDGKADIESSGSAVVLWTGENGDSLSPTEAGDPLAPFGARLVIFCRITVGALTDRVQLGVYTVVAVPESSDQSVTVNGTTITVGSTVKLTLKDRMVEVQRDRFTRLSQPSQLVSVYSELVTLTGFAITPTVADGAITRSVVYEEDRVQAIQDLADILNSTPFMESDGTLSLRSYTAGSVMAELKVGETGTITQSGSTLDTDGVYNGVIIRGETTSQAPILAEKWVTTGPLRATGDDGLRTPFHRRPAFYSSPYITTQEQANAIIDSLLTQYSSPRATQLTVTCVMNPLLQLGDVVKVTDASAVWTIRLTSIKYTTSGLMTVVGDVISRV